MSLYEHTVEAHFKYLFSVSLFTAKSNTTHTRPKNYFQFLKYKNVYKFDT